MQLYRSWEWTSGGPAGHSGWGWHTCPSRKGQCSWCRLFTAWRGDGFGWSNRKPLVHGSHQKTDPGSLRRFHDRRTRNNSHTLEMKIYQLVQSKQKPPNPIYWGQSNSGAACPERLCYICNFQTPNAALSNLLWPQIYPCVEQQLGLTICWGLFHLNFPVIPWLLPK